MPEQNNSFNTISSSGFLDATSLEILQESTLSLIDGLKMCLSSGNDSDALDLLKEIRSVSENEPLTYQSNSEMQWSLDLYLLHLLLNQSGDYSFEVFSLETTSEEMQDFLEKSRFSFYTRLENLKKIPLEDATQKMNYRQELNALYSLGLHFICYYEPAKRLPELWYPHTEHIELEHLKKTILHQFKQILVLYLETDHFIKQLVRFRKLIEYKPSLKLLEALNKDKLVKGSEYPHSKFLDSLKENNLVWYISEDAIAPKPNFNLMLSDTWWRELIKQRNSFREFVSRIPTKYLPKRKKGKVVSKSGRNVASKKLRKKIFAQIATDTQVEANW